LEETLTRTRQDAEQKITQHQTTIEELNVNLTNAGNEIERKEAEKTAL